MSARRRRGQAVVVLGDINIDILARIERFPIPGEDCLASALELHCGGVGANTALALAKWGLPVRLLGCIGRDAFGELALRFLRGEHVDVSQVQRSDRAMTGLMFIAVGADGQRTIFGSRGANAELTPKEELRYLEGAQAAHLVGYNLLSPSVAEMAERILRKAHQRRRLVSLDVGMAPSRQIPQKILQLAGKVDILFVGLSEATALTGKPDRLDAFGALRAHGVRDVVMKLGDQGCLFQEGDQLREAPPFPVTAADTTGAGDAFAAAFLWGRLRGWPRAESALLANAAGAAAACVVGAGEAMPGPQQILRQLRASRLGNEWDRVRIGLLERLGAELGTKSSGSSPGRLE